MAAACRASYLVNLLLLGPGDKLLELGQHVGVPVHQTLDPVEQFGAYPGAAVKGVPDPGLLRVDRGFKPIDVRPQLVESSRVRVAHVSRAKIGQGFLELRGISPPLIQVFLCILPDFSRTQYPRMHNRADHEKNANRQKNPLHYSASMPLIELETTLSFILPPLYGHVKEWMKLYSMRIAVAPAGGSAPCVLKRDSGTMKYNNAN